jgi:hypothetical protein
LLSFVTVVGKRKGQSSRPVVPLSTFRDIF